MVEIEANDEYRLTLFVVHHKSGRDYRHYLEAEALKVLDLIEGATGDDPSRNVVVLGDFNAAPWDKSLRIYLEKGFVDPLGHRSGRLRLGRLGPGLGLGLGDLLDRLRLGLSRPGLANFASRLTGELTGSLTSRVELARRGRRKQVVVADQGRDSVEEA